MNQSVLFILAVLWIGLFFCLFYSRLRVPLNLFLYDTRKEWKTIREKVFYKKLWKWSVMKIGHLFPVSLVDELNTLLRLSGNPYRYTAAGILTFEVIAGMAAVLIGLTSIQTGLVVYFFLVGYGLVFPIRQLYVKKKERQLEARAVIRQIKRRVKTQLKLGMGILDALVDASGYAPTQFGEVLRTALKKVNPYPLAVAMKEVREMYEVPELDSFCLAIEQSGESNEILVNMLENQIIEENSRIEEYLQAEADVLKPKLFGIIAILFAVTLGVSLYFLYLYLKISYDNGTLLPF